jgi:mannosylglucosylglycerate synthase
MKIGIIIGRIGGVDGVALETEKWIQVLRRMGHKIFIISGQYQNWVFDPEYNTLVVEMSFFSPESYWGQKKAFFHPDANIGELLEHIHLYSSIIRDKIVRWVREKNIDVVISENASALPAHLEMGLGISMALKELVIPTITHDHDFAWERGDRYVSPHQEINNLIEQVFPLRLPNSFHAVINLNAKKVLKDKYNRDAIVVPNVMDFDMEFGLLNNRNINMRRDLGLQSNEKLLFQVTRIVRRKGIEVAIDLIHRLEDDNVKLIITGDYKDDAGSEYYQELIHQIHELKVSNRVIFGSHLIHNKGLVGNGTEINYSLSDAYANATACTYFSTYEGFGNAFVEAVLARRPVFVNNYQPVYWPDIGSKGFKTVMLEENNLTDENIEEMRKIIFDDHLNREIADFNFALGKKYFSYDVLEEKLGELILRATSH